MEYLKRAMPLVESDRAALTQQVAGVLADIREHGEAAVRRYSAQFDTWEPTSFLVTDDEIAEATDQVPADVRAAIDFGQEQVRAFAVAQRGTMHELAIETRPGVMLGHRHIPIRSVGAYVPGGRYTLIGSSMMTIIPAKVAGVGRVVVCTPPAGGRVPPAMLYAAHQAGADAIYSVGGMQALGAMAYGALPGMDAVDMIVGAGNRFVTEAKRQLYGMVGIDQPAGPTEILILADETADPFLVAVDLVGQAEHGPDSRPILITTSRAVAEGVLGEMDVQLRAVSTESVARQAWEQMGEVILVADEDELARTSDDYAVEHVEIMTRDPHALGARLRNYGSLFIGEEATVAYGDKVSGPNHVLPTLRAARYTGGLWVGKFLKTVTYQSFTRRASIEMARQCAIECEAEGMVAHARTAMVRLDRYDGPLE